jgi:thiol-disulfide isomerase/thioredoxin
MVTSCVSQRHKEVLTLLNESSQLSQKIVAPAAVLFVNEVFCGPCISELAAVNGLSNFTGDVIVVVFSDKISLSKKKEISRKILDFLKVVNVRVEFVQGELSEDVKSQLRLDQEPKLLIYQSL